MAAIFWTSLTALLYTYAIYPIGIWLLALIRNRKVARAHAVPSISVVLACHNEAARIEARIRNLIETKYPQNRIEIIVAIDGATDDTEAIARRFQ